MTHAPFIVEVFLKSLAVLENLILWLPVLEAILEDEPNVSLEFRRTSILPLVHFGLDLAQTYWMLDDVEVLRAVMSDGVDRVLERTNKTGPEAGT